VHRKPVQPPPTPPCIPKVTVETDNGGADAARSPDHCAPIPRRPPPPRKRTERPRKRSIMGSTLTSPLHPPKSNWRPTMEYLLHALLRSFRPKLQETPADSWKDLAPSPMVDSRLNPLPPPHTSHKGLHWTCRRFWCTPSRNLLCTTSTKHVLPRERAQPLQGGGCFNRKPSQGGGVGKGIITSECGRADTRDRYRPPAGDGWGAARGSLTAIPPPASPSAIVNLPLLFSRSGFFLMSCLVGYGAI
jgi:hypothetical protein